MESISAVETAKKHQYPTGAERKKWVNKTDIRIPNTVGNRFKCLGNAGNSYQTILENILNVIDENPQIKDEIIKRNAEVTIEG